MNSTTSEKSSSRPQENKDGSSENMAASARSSRSSNSDYHETNKVASSKSSFENAKDNSANSSNITNQRRSQETKPASMEHSTKSSDAEERNSHSPSRTQEAASEKTSSENEKSEAKENHNTHLIPKHPPQCSEAATKKNAVNNNGKNQPPAIPGTKLSDAKTSNSKNSTGQGSNNGRSDSIDSNSTGTIKRHTGGDCRWEAVQLANARDAPLGLSHFRLLKRLGYGDIGSVYLVELRGTGAYFAMKVMDRASLVSRNKLLRAQTEREILGLLDHPFLPTLYCYFETEKFYCLVMEYCSGGNLHSLRQKQPSKHFTEQAARFYVSEVLLALEYLHMLGVIYRDLKPENVLVREEGHIMLSDFDLSLRCSVSPTLVNSQSTNSLILEGDQAVQSCIQPSSFFPRILPKRSRKSKSDFGVGSSSLPELLAEPTTVRSMSFVGTHEYLAPEIIKGEGHGSAVDWWTFGIFLYELLHGTTPFKGSGNKATLHNVVGQPLRFPEMPNVSNNARDLIRGLLVKDPQKRIAYRRGATEIKQHPFFEGVNWALVRSASPPHVPEPVDFSQFAVKEKKQDNDVTGGNKAVSTDSVAGGSKGVSTDSSHLDFEYF